MDKSRKNYWGVTQRTANNKDILFEGPFNLCWAWMMEQFGDWTVKALQDQQIKIERMAKMSQPIASWVIFSKETGLPLFQTYWKNTADAINRDQFDVIFVIENRGTIH